MRALMLTLAPLLLLVACGKREDTPPKNEGDTDTDADADSDTDADSDSDTDTDTDPEGTIWFGFEIAKGSATVTTDCAWDVGTYGDPLTIGTDHDWGVAVGQLESSVRDNLSAQLGGDWATYEPLVVGGGYYLDTLKQTSNYPTGYTASGFTMAMAVDASMAVDLNTPVLGADLRDGNSVASAVYNTQGPFLSPIDLVLGAGGGTGTGDTGGAGFVPYAFSATGDFAVKNDQAVAYTSGADSINPTIRITVVEESYFTTQDDASLCTIELVASGSVSRASWAN